MTWTGKAYAESAEEFIEYYGPLLAKLETWVAPGRLLDIGCGLGFFMEAARRRGWCALGIDPSPFCAEHARAKFSLDVTTASLDDARFPPASFDACVLVHSLEHLDDPVQALSRVAALLRPGGVVLIETPSLESDDCRAHGEKWFAWNVQEHTCLFSPATLSLALEAAGLRILDISAPVREPLPRGYVVHGWAERPQTQYATRAETVRAGLRIANARQGVSAVPSRPDDALPVLEPTEVAAAQRAGVLLWYDLLSRASVEVRRGEAAIIVAIALGLAASPRRDGSADGIMLDLRGPFFKDVPGGEAAASPAHPAWLHIHRLRGSGIVAGRPDGTFGPDEFLLRSELDLLATRAAKWLAQRGR